MSIVISSTLELMYEVSTVNHDANPNKLSEQPSVSACAHPTKEWYEGSTTGQVGDNGVAQSFSAKNATFPVNLNPSTSCFKISDTTC
jgi:hypothetical protein